MLVLILQKLDDLEVFLVTGAGNDGYTLALDGYPALYRSQLDNLVVAGGTDAWGCRYLGSQGGATSTPLVEVYAPGYGVSVANSIGSIKISDGTSIGEYFCYMIPINRLTSNTSASATVAGLAAYLQSKEGYSQNSFLKERILELQWARPEQPSDGSSQQRGFKCVNQWPNAIYNGARDGYTCPIEKRQVGGACSSSPPPTGTAGAVQSPITFTSGPPSPSCTAGCGTLCDSPNFCVAPCLTNCGNSPNPDFLDPADPNSPQNPNNVGGCQTTIASACQTSGTVVTCSSSLLCKTTVISTSAPTASSASQSTTVSSPPTTSSSPPTTSAASSTTTSPPQCTTDCSPTTTSSTAPYVKTPFPNTT
jgi:hypothetical protein